MRGRLIHPIADAIILVGWSFVAIPLCLFAGVVTFGIRHGTVGAWLGGLAGALVGLTFVLIWHWIRGRRTQPESGSSRPPSLSEPLRRRAVAPIPIPIPEGTPSRIDETTHGSEVFAAPTHHESTQERRSVMEQSVALGGDATASAYAHAIQKATLVDDLGKALALLQAGWALRDQLFLEPSTALAVGNYAATQECADVARWCLDHAGSLDNERLDPLRKSLSDIGAATNVLAAEEDK